MTHQPPRMSAPNPYRTGITAPLAIDLFCGLGGWTEGLLAEGYEVIGYDIEAHEYDGERYPAKLVLRDVLDIHGSELADADLIVASPPCQFFSYTAMPWSRAKALAAEVRADPEKLAERLALFNACFRIQREACEAAGRHIPLVVENVRGAIPWVGRSRWNYGSFHLWGDVPALMPPTVRATKAPGLGHGWKHPDDPRHTPGLDFTRLAGQHAAEATKVPGFRFDGSGRSFQTAAIEGRKNTGGSWFNIGSPGQKVVAQNPDGRKLRDADGYERNHPQAFGCPIPRTTSKGAARKAASARIAKIPLTLSRWIAAHYQPERGVA